MTYFCLRSGAKSSGDNDTLPDFCLKINDKKFNCSKSFLSSVSRTVSKFVSKSKSHGCSCRIHDIPASADWVQLGRLLGGEEVEITSKNSRFLHKVAKSLHISSLEDVTNSQLNRGRSSSYNNNDLNLNRSGGSNKTLNSYDSPSKTGTNTVNNYNNNYSPSKTPPNLNLSGAIMMNSNNKNGAYYNGSYDSKENKRSSNFSGNFNNNYNGNDNEVNLMPQSARSVQPNKNEREGDDRRRRGSPSRYNNDFNNNSINNHDYNEKNSNAMRKNNSSIQLNASFDHNSKNSRHRTSQLTNFSKYNSKYNNLYDKNNKNSYKSPHRNSNNYDKDNDARSTATTTPHITGSPSFPAQKRQKYVKNRYGDIEYSSSDDEKSGNESSNSDYDDEDDEIDSDDYNNNSKNHHKSNNKYDKNYKNDKYNKYDKYDKYDKYENVKDRYNDNEKHNSLKNNKSKSMSNYKNLIGNDDDNNNDYKTRKSSTKESGKSSTKNLDQSFSRTEPNSPTSCNKNRNDDFIYNNKSSHNKIQDNNKYDRSRQKSMPTTTTTTRQAKNVFDVDEIENDYNDNEIDTDVFVSPVLASKSNQGNQNKQEKQSKAVILSENDQSSSYNEGNINNEKDRRNKKEDEIQSSSSEDQSPRSKKNSQTATTTRSSRVEEKGSQSVNKKESRRESKKGKDKEEEEGKQQQMKRKSSRDVAVESRDVDLLENDNETVGSRHRSKSPRSSSHTHHHHRDNDSKDRDRDRDRSPRKGKDDADSKSVALPRHRKSSGVTNVNVDTNINGGKKRSESPHSHHHRHGSANTTTAIPREIESRTERDNSYRSSSSRTANSNTTSPTSQQKQHNQKQQKQNQGVLLYPQKPHVVISEEEEEVFEIEDNELELEEYDPSLDSIETLKSLEKALMKVNGNNIHDILNECLNCLPCVSLNLLARTILYCYAVRVNQAEHYFLLIQRLDKRLNDPAFMREALKIVDNCPKNSEFLNELKFIGNCLKQQQTQQSKSGYISIKIPNPKNHLMSLIRRDDVDQLKLLSNIDFNGSFSSKSDKEFRTYSAGYLSKSITYLEYSAFYGSLNCFKYILENKAEVTEHLPLYAVAGGNFEIVKLCEDELCCLFDDCPLLAAKFHRWEIFEWLVDKQMETYENQHIFNTCLEHANFRTLHKVIKRKKGKTPKMMTKAAKFDCYALYKWLMANVKNLDETNDQRRIKRRLIVMKPPNGGFTSIHYSVINQNLKFLKLLLDISIDEANDYTTRDKFEPKVDPRLKAPIHFACSKIDSDLKLLRLLLRTGKIADINEGAKGINMTCLHYAAKCGNVEIVQYLLKRRKIKVNAQTTDRMMTPLHFACQNNHFEVVQLILAKKGVDPSLKNVDGKTPQQLSKESEIRRLF